MKPPKNTQHILFGGTFVLANKLQYIGDKMVDGLSTKQWFLLRNLMDLPADPPPSITQIAKSMDSTRQNITQMLELMEREGYVEISDSESDHRSRCVRLTDAGNEYAKKTAENAQDFLNRLYEDISPKEREAAAGVMMKMMANLERMQEEV